MHRQILSLAAFVLCAPSAVAAAPLQSARTDVWTERDFGNAAPQLQRSYSFIAYDSKRQELVRFGGYTGQKQAGGTWTWDGTSWTKRSPAQEPPARFAYGNLVYDELRERVVLFGGRATPRTLSDTWEWDGVTWTQALPATRPPARQNHGIVYDKARGQVLIFGGDNAFGKPLDDFWAWDGTNWTELNPIKRPSKRFGLLMAYDDVRQRVVLFGGARATNFFNDTWEWDGVAWTRSFPLSSPAPRGLAGLTFDGSRGELVLFGGWDLQGWRRDLWTWDGSDWKSINLARGPSARCCPGFSYDYSTGRTVLFGGCDNVVVNDTWELYEGAQATLATMPGSHVGPTLDADPSALPWIGEDFQLNLHGAEGSFAVGIASLGLREHDMVMPGFEGRSRPYPMMLRSVFARTLLPVAASSAAWLMSIPPDPNLLGAEFHVQAATRSAAGEVIFSNPSTALIGAR